MNRRIRIGMRFTWPALGAALIALSVAAAAGASEYEVRALPELGRCVSVGVGNGVYTGASCAEVNKHGRGAYEWHQLAEKVTFSNTGSSVTLATSGHALTCTALATAGEWTGAKTASATIELKGCVNQQAHACQSLGQAAGTIVSNTLEGELGFIRNEVKEGKTYITVGLDLKAKSPSTAIATYECGSLTETATIEGSVIAQISPVNKMTLESNLLYRVNGKTGAQIPEKFQGGPKDTLSTTFTSGVTSTTLPTTMRVSKKVLGKQASSLEIKAKEF